MSHSLRRRLIGLVLLACSVVWVIVAALSWFVATASVDRMYDHHLAQAAALLVAHDSMVPDRDNTDHVAPPYPDNGANEQSAFQVWHADRLMSRSANAPDTPMSPTLDGFENRQIRGQPWRVYSTHTRDADLIVQVGEPETTRDGIRNVVLASLFMPILLLLPLLAAGCWWSVNRAMRPLDRVSHELKERRVGLLEPVAHDDAPDEVQPMLSALNGLFAQVRTLIDSERRFTADAAHELRTPIAGIRAQAQVALGAMASADPTRVQPAARRAMEAVLQGSDRLTRIVEQLLMLSRLDEGQALRATESIDVVALARQITGEMALRAAARQQSIAFEGEASAQISGSSALLDVMLRNLVRNASQYSPEGAQILVSVHQGDGAVEIAVDDDGPGMSPDEIGRLGERFFRGGTTDASGPAEQANGSGLGWSIVQRIAGVHGGRASAGRSERLGGFRAAVWLPRS